MSNVNAPNGLAPVRYMNGAPWNQQANLYYIPSGNTDQFGIGSVVKLDANSDANGVPAVALAANTDTPVGVVVGVEPVHGGGASLVGTSLSLETIAIPATKAHDYYVMVVDDPQVVFEIQANNAATLVNTTCITANATFTVAAPATGSPFAATVLDATSFAVTSTLPLTVLGLTQKPNADLTAYTRFLVKFNKHAFLGGFTAPAHL